MGHNSRELTAGSNLSIKLIIGLGNPGKDYEKTFHNAGFLFLKFLLTKINPVPKIETPKNKSFKSAKLGEITAVWPKTFMNESGRAAAEAAKYFKVLPAEILVVHDDADIALGEYKLSFDQGSAGHNGVISIIKHLKTQKIWRLRIGVGKNKAENGKPRKKAGDYVLQNASKKDLELIEKSFADFIAFLLTQS